LGREKRCLGIEKKRARIKGKNKKQGDKGRGKAAVQLQRDIPKPQVG